MFYHHSVMCYQLALGVTDKADNIIARPNQVPDSDNPRKVEENLLSSHPYGKQYATLHTLAFLGRKYLYIENN